MTAGTARPLKNRRTIHVAKSGANAVAVPKTDIINRKMKNDGRWPILQENISLTFIDYMGILF